VVSDSLASNNQAVLIEGSPDLSGVIQYAIDSLAKGFYTLEIRYRVEKDLQSFKGDGLWYFDYLPFGYLLSQTPPSLGLFNAVYELPDDGETANLFGYYAIENATSYTNITLSTCEYIIQPLWHPGLNTLDQKPFLDVDVVVSEVDRRVYIDYISFIPHHE
jgi:hypothetical protein